MLKPYLKDFNCSKVLKKFSVFDVKNITNKKSAFFVLIKKTAVEINILGLQFINVVPYKY